MRDYGKVHSTFWSSPTTSSMSDDAKMLALYLMTCTHSTIAGVFRLPDGYVAEDLAWPSERVAKGFVELFQKGFANRCETTKWVWICKHLEWNKPENPNQRKSAQKFAQSIPDECVWKRDFMRVCGHFLDLAAALEVNPSGTVSEPFLNQKQETEAETEDGALSPQAATAPQNASRGSRLPTDWELPDAWREWAEGERPDLPVDLVADSFRDFWVSKPGKDGRKSDWHATWRNWIRAQKPMPSIGRVTKNPLIAGAI